MAVDSLSVSAAEWPRELSDADIENIMPIEQTDARWPAPPVHDRAADELPYATCALDAPPPEPIGWGARDFLLARELGLFVGEDGSFKSTCALHVAGAQAGGYAVFGRFRTEARPALYVSEEDPPGVLAQRLEALVKGHGWDRARVLANVHFLAMTGVSLANVAWQAQLRAEVDRLNAGLVILDPWAELIEGSENENSDMRPFIKFTRSLAQPTGATPLVVHHLGKAAEGKRPADRIRGATALRHASRSTYHFEDRGDCIGVECLKLSRARKLPPFTLTRRIETDPENRAMWKSARLIAVSPHERATRFVLDMLRLEPGANTTEVKKAAADKGVRGEDVSNAIVTLERGGAIAFDKGAKGAKLWKLAGESESASSLPTAYGQGGQAEKSVVAQVAQGCPGQPHTSRSGTPSVVAPLKRGQPQGASDSVVARPSAELYETSEGA